MQIYRRKPMHTVMPGFLSLLVGSTRCTLHCTECTAPHGHRHTRQTHIVESTGASGPGGRPGQISVFRFPPAPLRRVRTFCVNVFAVSERQRFWKLRPDGPLT